MAFKDTLDAIPASGKSHTCRICQLIAELPEPDSSHLKAAAMRHSGVSLPRLVEALMAEGHGNLTHSAKHHRYICGNS